MPVLHQSTALFLVFTCFIGKVELFYADNQNYDCGAILTDIYGVIESPNFPDPYPPEAFCVWEIRGDEGARIQLDTVWFSVEGQATECLWDSVVIQDGVDGEYGRQVHCGSSGFRFLSTSNIVRISFKSDASGIDPGFQIRYDIRTPAVKSCNQTITKEGFVESPNFPQLYPNSQTCFITITAPDHHKTQVNFTEFEVETWPCNFDRLEILYTDYNGALTMEQSLCGRDLPPVYTTDRKDLVLKFVSDADVRSRGFRAKVRFLPHNDVHRVTPPTTTTTTTTTPTSTATTPFTFIPFGMTTIGRCNQTIIGSDFNISSPSYPAHYPLRTHCITKLRADVKSTFVLTFLNFSIEESENCSYDSLSFYTVDEKVPKNKYKKTYKKKLSRKVCGTMAGNSALVWEAHGLDLVFHSDTSVTGEGYLATLFVAPITKEKPRCPDVCQNGGTCQETLLSDGSVDWLCLCTADYTGVLCEIVSQQSCLSMTCQNGGSCRPGSPRAQCVCPHGYSGIHCEQTPDDLDKGDLYFTKMTGNLSLSVGSTAILECAVNDEKANVMWLFNDHILTSDASSGVDVHHGGVVAIREANDALSGRYTCMAVTPGDLIERSLWITLVEPCSLEVAKHPENVTVKEGHAALFKCFVPDADVTLWRKDGELITQGTRKRILVNHYLSINPVVETDAGQYTCAARGANGCFSKTSAYLTVQTTGHGKECGRSRNPSTDAAIVGRISSGREAPPGSAPWHVILREARKDTTFCGGSLVSPDTVLTAAHCVSHFEATFGYPFHPRHIQIYIGTRHCVGRNGIYRQLKWFRVHEHFNNTNYNNDVAVFRLDRPVDYSDDVTPICLEKPTFVEELMKPGRLGVITGCGGRHAQGLPPTYLHEVQIPIVARDVCRERAGVVGTTFTQGMFCAGYARSMRGDACRGDSGGAFSLRFHERSVLVGIVSWGVGCDWEDHYGYYTNVAHYYDWIIDKIDLA